MLRLSLRRGYINSSTRGQRAVRAPAVRMAPCCNRSFSSMGHAAEKELMENSHLDGPDLRPHLKGEARLKAAFNEDIFDITKRIAGSIDMPGVKADLVWKLIADSDLMHKLAGNGATNIGVVNLAPGICELNLP